MILCNFCGKNKDCIFCTSDIERLQDLLNMYKCDFLKQYVFKHACSNGFFEIAEHLVKEVDIEMNDNVCLINASSKGYIDIIKMLIDNGTNISSKNNLSFRSACAYGNLDIAKLLLEKGAKIHSKNDYAIRWASYYGHYEVVKFLVEMGANINAKNDLSLRLACTSGSLAMVKYLVEVGAKCCDDALFRASQNGHVEIVKFLVENGCSIEIASERDKAYILLCQKNKLKKQIRAQKKIYFWWIPICYDLNRECGKRMAEKNLQKFLEME
jgi:ankyrin repeat protein